MNLYERWVWPFRQGPDHKTLIGWYLWFAVCLGHIVLPLVGLLIVAMFGVAVVNAL